MNLIYPILISFSPYSPPFQFPLWSHFKFSFARGFLFLGSNKLVSISKIFLGSFLKVACIVFICCFRQIWWGCDCLPFRALFWNSIKFNNLADSINFLDVQIGFPEANGCWLILHAALFGQYFIRKIALYFGGHQKQSQHCIYTG